MKNNDSTSNINIEVAYAKPHEQKIIALQVSKDTTVSEAIQQSNICHFFPEIQLTEVKVGIFGKLINQPDSHQVTHNDRIEIYRPLIADLKSIRKKRAEKLKLKQ